MESVVRKPVVIAVIVAAISIATLLVMNHTNLIVDRQPPADAARHDFNTVNDAGATVAPTTPEPSIKPVPPGPVPVQPAAPAK